jgi:hypothetical protein
MASLHRLTMVSSGTSRLMFLLKVQLKVTGGAAR